MHETIQTAALYTRFLRVFLRPNEQYKKTIFKWHITPILTNTSKGVPLKRLKSFYFRLKYPKFSKGYTRKRERIRKIFVLTKRVHLGA